ncbi:MAG: methyltransferase [Saprospiraceae bacterium]|nr:methyltransferase [Saprospiraceae bacterium]
MRRILKPFLWFVYKWYLSKPRWYHYNGLKVRVLPTVFHPGLLLSTKILLEFISTLDLKDKSVLELGAGSGLISLVAARQGSEVPASDISPIALDSIREGMSVNKLNIGLIESDLFDAIPLQKFDYIFINPPFYPQQPKNLRELAFFCGKNLDYFKKLFSTIGSVINLGSRPFMILSDNCDIREIIKIGSKNAIKMLLVHEVRKRGESLFIYELKFNILD